MTIPNIVKDFLAGLRRTRTSHRSSANAIYWRTAEAIAKGTRPKDKETDIAEALEKLGRDEDNLAADAQRLASLAQVEHAAAKEPDARTRLKAANTAQAAAERRAAERRREDDKIRSEAQAATTEARNEVDLAMRAGQRAQALRLELDRLGHPDYAGANEKRERQLAIERVEGDLRMAEDELSSLPDDPNRRVRRDRLVRELDELRHGAPLRDDNDDDSEIIEQEVEVQ